MHLKVQTLPHNPTSEETLERIRRSIPELLSESRYRHTIFVEKEAITIAQMIFLVYNEKSILMNDISAAALLHDITKKCTLEEHLEMCEKYGIDAGEYPSEAVLHSKTAAYLAKSLFDINDNVFNAVFNHTLGSHEMSVTDKIIFLADYIEESRTYASSKAVRDYFYSQCNKRDVSERMRILDESVVMSIDETLLYLLKNRKTIDPMTVKTRNYLVSHTV